MEMEKTTRAGLECLEVPGDPSLGGVLLFHGFGADAHDLLPISQIYPGPTWIFPNAPLEVPIAPGYTGRAWFPLDMELLREVFQTEQFENVEEAFPHDYGSLCRLGEELIGSIGIPRSKLFLGGFSQGSIFATELALSARDRAAGLIVLSGILVNQDHWIKRAHAQRGMPFFQSHGVQDPILPFNRAQALEKVFLEGGLEGKLHAFHGGHEIPQPILIHLRTFLEAKFSLS